jgi:photosystem II stability/assembly factor-like uncharacterized protein
MGVLRSHLRGRRVWLRAASAFAVLGPTLGAGPVLAQPTSFPRPIRADRASFFALARSGPVVLAAGERGVFARSVDEGRSWQVARLAGTRNLTTALGHPDGLALLAGHGGTLFRSDDAGGRWEAVDPVVLEAVNPDHEPFLCGLVEPSGRILLGGAFGLLIESTDRGRSWRPIQTPAEGFDRHVYGLFQSADREELWLVGESGAIFRARPGGAWIESRAPYEGSFFGGLITAQGRPLVFGMRGTILLGDGEAPSRSWQLIETGSTVSWMSGRLLPEGRIVLVGDQGWVALSDDQGQRWRLIHLRDGALADLIGVASGAFVTAGVLGLVRHERPVNGPGSGQGGRSAG